MTTSQAADRVNVVSGPAISGTIVAVSPVGIDVENASGDTQKVPIENVREVQFGAEPQSLRNARGLLLRGRGADARDQVGKIDPEEISADEALVLAELDFVRAAAAGKATLEAGGDLAAAAAAVGEYLAKHPKSHHFYPMQELLGDLEARAGRPEQALAAYRSLEGGPTAMRVRAATAKAGMMLAQGQTAEALAEYDAAIALAGNDASSEAQKQLAGLGKARCLSSLGRHDDAISLVDQLIRLSDPQDKELLARAYTVLGDSYRAMGGRDQDALIQFLTVDLVYNMVPESHAEALYNLAELWEKSRHPERAGEARQALKTTYPASPWAAKLDRSKP